MLAAWRGTGPRPTLAVAFPLSFSTMACAPRVSRYSVLRRKPFLNRSAGACPPRSSDLNEKRPRSKGLKTFSVTIDAWRGTGPRPTVTGTVSYFRTRKTPDAQRPRLFLVTLAAWRGTGPRPTVKGAFPLSCPPRCFFLADLRRRFPLHKNRLETRALILKIL